MEGRTVTWKPLTFALPLAAAVSGAALSGAAAAKDRPEVVAVVQATGTPWSDGVDKGVRKGGAEFGLNASTAGLQAVDAAWQARLVDDLIARKVDAIGLIPVDARAMEPVMQRAAAAGIPVITQATSWQKTKTWNIDPVDPKAFAEAQMEALARAMGGEGAYVVLIDAQVGPLPTYWAGVAEAYQKARYPKMRQIDRLQGADQVDRAYNVVKDLVPAYPEMKGVLGLGWNGPIGAGNALRDLGLQGRIAVTGTCLPGAGRQLIVDGVVRECFLWSPIDAGYAMMAVARLVLDGKEITDGMEIPGLGKVAVDPAAHSIRADRMLRADKETVDTLVGEGL
jgi:simple sugar transport system substrate-binding protein